jgi:hypothetical protein
MACSLLPGPAQRLRVRRARRPSPDRSLDGRPRRSRRAPARVVAAARRIARALAEVARTARDAP